MAFLRRKRDEFRFEPIDTKKDVAVGIGLPFTNRTGGLFSLNYTTEEQAVHNLINLLLTKKGERVMQPAFGWGGWDLLMEHNGPDLVEKLRHTLKQDIGLWLPYIIIDNIDITAKLDFEVDTIGNGVKISLSVRIEPTLANKVITIELTEDGAINVTTT
jgi:phage baseplate assembly protein W